MKKLFCLLAIVASTHLTQAQTTIVTGDLESWSTVGLTKKLGDQFKVTLDQQFRLDYNSTNLAKYLTDLSIDYKLSKRFKISAGYRYIAEKDEESGIYENLQRFNADFTYKHKLDRLALSYRLRLQTKNEIGLSKAEGDEAVNYIRFRVKAAYNIPDWKLDPYLSSELFRKNKEDIDPIYNNLRFTLGTNYKLKGFGTLGGFYRIERELGTTYPKTTYIVGLKLRYNL